MGTYLIEGIRTIEGIKFIIFINIIVFSIFLAVYISASVNMSNIIPNSLSMQGEREMGMEGKGLFVFAVMAESKGAIGNILCRNLIFWSKVHFLSPSHGFSDGNIAYCLLQSWIFRWKYCVLQIANMDFQMEILQS